VEYFSSLYLALAETEIYYLKIQQVYKLFISFAKISM